MVTITPRGTSWNAWCGWPSGHNLRAVIEAIVRSVKHPFPAGKLLVRGLFRAARMVIGSAAVSNVRQVHRYLVKQKKLENALAQAADLLYFAFPPHPPTPLAAFRPIFRLVKSRFLQRSH